MRNGLASRIGGGAVSRRDVDPISRDRYDYDDNIVSEPPKKRVRILNIPLDASDYLIEDIVKEIAQPVFANIDDHDSGRTAVFEFEDPAATEKVVEAFKGREINGVNVDAEVFELRSRQSHRVQKRGHRGGRRGPRTAKKERPPQLTADDLDKELEAYMKE